VGKSLSANPRFLSPSRGRGQVRGCGFKHLHPHPDPLPQGRGSYRATSKKPIALSRDIFALQKLAFFKNNTILRVSQEVQLKREGVLWISPYLKKLWKKREGSELFLKGNCLRLFHYGMSRPLFRDPSSP
jgi:hypothetical protein